MIKIRTGAAVLLGAAGLSAIASLVPATALAHADSSVAWTTNQDTVFVRLCASNGIYNTNGPAAEALVGRNIAADLANGVPPIVERDRVYSLTNITVSLTDANVLVNAAEVAYLGGVAS